jgi:hypothetical protein
MKIGIGERIEIQPCTEEGMVTLEAVLGGSEEVDYYDPEVMEKSLRYAPFEDIKFSKEMGYAFAFYQGKRIHIFKQGKIIIRRANDTDDAMKVLKLCVKALLPAIICEPNMSAIACYKGEYEECLKDCQPLKKLIMGQTHTLKFLDLLKDPPSEIANRKTALKKFIPSIWGGGIRAKDYSGFLESERREVYKTMIESEDHVVITACLSLLALYDNLEEILNMLFAEEGEERSKEVLDIVCGTLSAIIEGDMPALKSAIKKNDEMLAKTEKPSLRRALECIANISRSAQKTVLR